MGVQDRRTALVAAILGLEPLVHRALGPIRASSWADVDVTMSQLKMMFVLHDSFYPGGRDGLRVGEVARLLGVTLPTVTAVMDKLVERGYVRRDEDRDDRRQHVCRLTAAGRESLDQLMAGHRARMEGLLGHMTVDELGLVARTMRLFIVAAKRLTPPDAEVNVPEAATVR